MKYLKIALLAIALTLGLAATAKYSRADDNYELARRIILLQSMIQNYHESNMQVVRNVGDEEIVDNEISVNEIDFQNVYFAPVEQDSPEVTAQANPVAVNFQDPECEQTCIDKEFICNNTGRPEFICETEWQLCNHLCSNPF
jgi:hypothetical protein